MNLLYEKIFNDLSNKLISDKSNNVENVYFSEYRDSNTSEISNCDDNNFFSPDNSPVLTSSDYKKMEKCFKNMSLMIPKWFSVMPKWPQSDPNMTLKLPQNDFNMTPNSSQSDPNMTLKWFQSDPNMTLTWPQHDPNMILTWH